MGLKIRPETGWPLKRSGALHIEYSPLASGAPTTGRGAKKGAVRVTSAGCPLGQVAGRLLGFGRVRTELLVGRPGGISLFDEDNSNSGLILLCTGFAVHDCPSQRHDAAEIRSGFRLDQDSNLGLQPRLVI